MGRDVDFYSGDVSPSECWSTLSNGDKNVYLIDVRTDVEWHYVGVPDLDTLGIKVIFIEWYRWPDKSANEEFSSQLLDAIPNKKGSKLFFLCRGGVRSKFAAIKAYSLGYEFCYNVSDGFEGQIDESYHRGLISGWKALGLPWKQS